MFILNDIHLGSNRKAGTTPTSAAALKQYLQSEFAGLVHRCHGHLVILGDLFDGFSVDVGDVITAYETLCDYVHDGGRVVLVCGNHDHSLRPGTSSFHLLAHFLKSRFPNEISVIDYTIGLSSISGDVWAIPHMPNQALFDLEVEKAVSTSGKYLLVHCNIMSPWESSDHSLNLDDKQLDRLVGAGWKLLVAHEHAGRTLYNGDVHIIGNQIVSSVSDCLNDLNESKVFVQLTDTGLVEHHACTLSTLYAKLDWRNLEDVDPALKFIRVGGDASANEAADAVAAIAKLRQNHNAFVITNAVMVEGMGTEMEEASLESLKAFDVLSALLEVLDPKEQEVVKELLC